LELGQARLSDSRDHLVFLFRNSREIIWSFLKIVASNRLTACVLLSLREGRPWASLKNSSTYHFWSGWRAIWVYQFYLAEGRGECLYENLIPENITLSGTVESLEGKDKELFLDFVSHVLHWLPETRKSAKELAAHPWLKDL
jgi:hypothetical protein